MLDDTEEFDENHHGGDLGVLNKWGHKDVKILKAHGQCSRAD